MDEVRIYDSAMHAYTLKSICIGEVVADSSGNVKAWDYDNEENLFC